MVILALIVLGIIFGSFVNALVWRLHNNRNWVSERSECVHCHHHLSAKDLVPVVSYVLLRGKCRYCHKSIDDTPLAELALPILFVVSFLAWPVDLQGFGLVQFVFWLVYLIILLALTISDLRWFLLPDKLVATLTVLTITELMVRILLFRDRWQILFGSGVGALIISGLFYLLFQISQGKWIGGGDVKLGVPLGILAGGALNSLLLLFAASISGTIVAVVLMFTGKVTRKAVVPFGPFLILGLIIVRLWGEKIIGWYLGLL